MSLTVGDAIHINTIAQSWLDNCAGRPQRDPDQVVDALAQLADRAHAKLGAGITGEQVRAADQ